MPGTTALIVAAGRGQRAGAGLPKQYRPLAGRPAMRHACLAFLRHPGIDHVRVVIHPDDRQLYEAAVTGLNLLPPVPGGAARQESCLKGLEALAEDAAPDRVLIHDAARPLVDHGTIGRVIDALHDATAIVAGVPVIDTLKRTDPAGWVSDTVDRTGLWRAQTPQGFQFSEILLAHRAAAGRALTDDAAVAEAAGLTVRIVEGSETNMKLTTEADFEHAERLLSGRDIRVGMGFDVHRFGPGQHVMLCGIAVPHDLGLQGHSDADVGLHALTDAILGTIAAGDIGGHFPPTEAVWRGADSAQFLTRAAALVAERGGEIRHLDVTLICERPKIGPYREAMRQRIALIAGIPLDRVSVKATTTEGLGFTGRNEGIAAQATATICL